MLSGTAEEIRQCSARYDYPADNAAGHLRDLRRLDLTVVPAELLADGALDIASAYRITVYDACYVSAAVQRRLPLITADRKLVVALAESSFDIQWLGGIETAD